MKIDKLRTVIWLYMGVTFGLSTFKWSIWVRACENRVLRKVFDCTTEQVIEGFSKLYDRNL